MNSFFKIVLLTILSVLAVSFTESQAMRCTDSMVTSETAIIEDAVFEEADYVHTLRTIDHMLREQRAEMACLPISTNGETKVMLVSPSYTDVQRALMHQRTAMSLLSADHPIRTRYITHSYYVYALEKILI